MNEEVQEKAMEMTKIIYANYGSGTDYLFGISPEHKGAVQAIVLCVLENIECSDEGVVLK